MTVTIVVLVAALTVVSVAAWLLPRVLPQRLWAFATLALLVALGLLAVLAGPDADLTGLPARSVLVDLALVAVLGGGPVTSTVLWLVDRGSTRPDSLAEDSRRETVDREVRNSRAMASMVRSCR